MDTANTPLSILIVEDSDNLREAICDALSSIGHQVRGIDCAEALPEQVALLQIDLAILDLNLPGEDGLSLAKRLRASHPEIGIIMLTARVTGAERASGYAGGADIYLTKPASLDELKQAIAALARRIKPVGTIDSAGTYLLDTERMLLSNGQGSTQSLVRSGATLLAAFVRAPEKILENWQIAEILEMDTASINKPAIELHIVRLRKKLQSGKLDHSPIQAVRGRGYQLCVPVRLVKLA